jgi:hypothetical protein
MPPSLSPFEQTDGLKAERMQTKTFPSVQSPAARVPKQSNISAYPTGRERPCHPPVPTPTGYLHSSVRAPAATRQEEKRPARSGVTYAATRLVVSFLIFAVPIPSRAVGTEGDPTSTSRLLVPTRGS